MTCVRIEPRLALLGVMTFLPGMPRKNDIVITPSMPGKNLITPSIHYNVHADIMRMFLPQPIKRRRVVDYERMAEKRIAVDRIVKGTPDGVAMLVLECLFGVSCGLLLLRLTYDIVDGGFND